MDSSVPVSLRRQIADGRLFHSYIVTGPSAGKREELARWLAAAAVCSGDAPPCMVCPDCVKAMRDIHADIVRLERGRDGRGLSVDAMRACRADAYVMPNEAGRKVYIIAGADQMLPPAQNAMLKIFEEPPKTCVFILTAENPGRLLPTVRSRCVTVTAEGEEGGETAEDAARLVDILLDGDGVEAVELLAGLEQKDRDALASLFAGAKRVAAGLIGRRDTEARRSDSLRSIIDILETAEKYNAANVSTAGLAGQLLAGYTQIQKDRRA